MKIKVEEAEKRADLTTCLDITKRKHLFVEYLSITEIEFNLPFLWMCRSM